MEEALVELGPWYLSRLFLKVASADISTLERLSSLDEISFAYVSAKLERPLDEDRARELLKKNWEDERAGLLVWSFGQMGFWSVLAEIPELIGGLLREKRARTGVETMTANLGDS